MNLTQEQEKIILSDGSLILVNAMAGTGKTSTLLKFCEEKIRKHNATFAYFTFNASMAREAQEKFAHLKKNILFCGTIHSYALRNIKNSDYYKKRLGLNKSLKSIHIEKILNISEESILFAILKAFKSFLVSDKELFEMDFSQTIDEKSFELLMDYFGKQDAIKGAILKIWEAVDQVDDMPYEHDFYLKNFQLYSPKIKADYILIDEAQDLNPVMLGIVKDQKAKLVFVGDTHQQIYDFRGCVNALEILKDTKDSQTLFLTKTFRCPQRIVQKVIPYLTLLGVPNERMLSGFEKEYSDFSEKRPTVICRTNAGILDYILENPNKKPTFVGGIASYDFKKIIEIGLVLSKKKELKKFIKDDLLKSFKDKEEFYEYLEESQDLELKTRLNMFHKLISRGVNPFEFIKEIKDYKDNYDVVLTTAHKSKGLEWDFVEIYNDFPKIKEASEINFSEINLLYVAITRTKNQLFLPAEYEISEKELKAMLGKLKILRKEV